MEHTIEKLVSTLTRQSFGPQEAENVLLEQYKQYAEACAKIDAGILILSDFRTHTCYTYAGTAGARLGIPWSGTTFESAFEDHLFSRIHPEDLKERHLLELNYFNYQKGVPVHLRRNFNTWCRLRIKDAQGNYRLVIHRTCYVGNHANGSVWLALCFYTPVAEETGRKGFDGKIVNNQTGEVVLDSLSRTYDTKGLTQRELEILRLIARGKGSKEIAAELRIALYTVYRHRQNIIQKLQTANTTEAVRIAAIIGVI